MCERDEYQKSLKEVHDQIGAIGLECRCSFDLFWPECDSVPFIYTKVFSSKFCICSLFLLLLLFSFTHSLCLSFSFLKNTLIDNDLAINFMFVSSAVRFGLFFCVCDQVFPSIAFYTFHHITPAIDFADVFLFFLSFLSIFAGSALFFFTNFICCGCGHKLSPSSKLQPFSFCSGLHFGCHCCFRFVQST